MKTKVYCIVSDKGVLSFFLYQDNRRYFLFSQNYRKSVYAYFKHGVSVDESLSFKKTHGDSALIHTMDKLPAYIKYIEKEYQIPVYKKTKTKNSKNLTKRSLIESIYREESNALAYGI